ncbi:MAG TPA: hypothetical protein DCE71_06560 [Parachlamydiales bacterium]|nr:hypothetical protein [Parachlamydiales bacterium]
MSIFPLVFIFFLSKRSFEKMGLASQRPALKSPSYLFGDNLLKKKKQQQLLPPLSSCRRGAKISKSLSNSYKTREIYFPLHYNVLQQFILRRPSWHKQQLKL